MKIAILGGGISGLSAAWFLKKKIPHAQVVLYEKENRLGGAIRTEQKEDFLFEKGPRTFQLSRSPMLLQLIHEVGLEKELLFSDSGKRYIWHRGRLRSLGSFWPLFFRALCLEPFVPRSQKEDESIFEFAVRRFGLRMAETFFDPLALGIYGGDIRTLSIRSCFPTLFAWEKEKGSVVWGMFSNLEKRKGLFTLRRGVESLIEALKKKLEIEVILNTEVKEIPPADKVIVALPSKQTLLSSLWVVNLGFHQKVLFQKGFGYLVPTLADEPLLGMVWDSNLFPDQNRENQTRLTAMVRYEEKKPIETALEALQRHLKIKGKPDFISLFEAKRGLPQFPVGYWKTLDAFEQNEKVAFVGNYFLGPSVEACIQRSFNEINLLKES